MRAAINFASLFTGICAADGGMSLRGCQLCTLESSGEPMRSEGALENT